MASYPNVQNAGAVPQSTVVQTVSSYGQYYNPTGQQLNSIQTSHSEPLQRHKKTLHGLGFAECIIGALSMILAIAAIAIADGEARQYYNGWYYYSGVVALSYSSQGIWCGVLVIITGILGISAKKSPSRGMYIANMTMAIITAFVLSIGTVISGLAIGSAFFSSSLVALHSVITILCFSAMIITIIHSAFCCSGVCAIPNSTVTQIRYPNPQNIHLPPQYIQGPNGQLIMVSGQPVVSGTSAIVSQAPVMTAYPGGSTMLVQQPNATVYANAQGKERPPSYSPVM